MENIPWRVDDLEHRSYGGFVYWVFDRNNVLVAVFPDQQQARAVVELVNGSARIPHEAGRRN
jgi:hypothetical protein